MFPTMHSDEFLSMLRPDYRPLPTFFQNALVLEFLFWVAVLALTCIFLKRYPKFLVKLESWSVLLSRKQGLSCILILLAALALRAALLPLVPVPDPIVHDEYSYLLQAKTFASGRLTNPTPLGWTHFETFHVNMRPTYQSMYPPGQATFLAAGEVLHLRPWWGVWLSMGLMCGAICWMLQDWVPPQWALLGGLFCVVRFATFSYWVNSYWSGAVAATGGALVYGALPRLRRAWKPIHGIVFALGLGLLANTRPYEGFVCSIPALIAISWWFFSSSQRKEIRFRGLAPAIAVLLLIAIAMGYYNWRNTGNPLELPYVVNQREYHITKPFVWQTPYPMPSYRHAAMKAFFVQHELVDYQKRKSPWFVWDFIGDRVEAYYEFFVWPMMIPLIFGFWAMMKSRKKQILPITLFLFFGGVLIEQWQPEPHYGAPILGIVLSIFLYSLRLARTWVPKGLSIGPAFVRAVVFVILAWSLVPLGRTILDPYKLSAAEWTHGRVHRAWIPSQIERDRIISQLQNMPGKHLIFVRWHPRPDEVPSIFWIYNDPDLAESKIIWAYDMGESENTALMRLYPTRYAWFVDKDSTPMLLTPYQLSDDAAAFVLAQLHESKTYGK